ncbi:potassium-transporting ATPase subunit KdpA [Paenibacillus aceris]|uniref:potassium-transporting ATPase subunit KdpA n=1 Tax=Paenibacillus aceris TaxID=869555 RepID=UPI001423B781|nr:potassium-transporting ATPase subunit KdpA [Paenibacillus aceris]
MLELDIRSKYLHQDWPGWGWFGTNSAHPFENPTPLTKLIVLRDLVSTIKAAALLTLPAEGSIMVLKIQEGSPENEWYWFDTLHYSEQEHSPQACVKSRRMIMI